MLLYLVRLGYVDVLCGFVFVVLLDFVVLACFVCVRMNCSVCGLVFFVLGLRVCVFGVGFVLCVFWFGVLLV